MPVYSLAGLEMDLTKDIVIFVAVKNVYYHEDIVETLNSRGFFKIIYKSPKAISGEMDIREKILDDAYEGIYKKGNVLPLHIPVITVQKKIGWQENFLLEECEDNVVVKIPVELLFTGVTDAVWANVPVLLLFPYIDLFYYFRGQEQYFPDDYLDLCQKGARSENLKITNGWKEYVLQNRRDIFEQMYLKYEFEPNYFLEHAPKVRWSSNGFFTIETGKHRVCFLISAGTLNIPVRISKADWTEFLDYDAIDRLKGALGAFKNKRIPVPHPFFQGTVQFNSFPQLQVLQGILRVLYKEKWMTGSVRKINTIIDCTETAGYYARFFSSMGLEAFVGKGQLCCIDEINSLFKKNIPDYSGCTANEAVIIVKEQAGLGWIESLGLKKYYLFQIDDHLRVHYKECWRIVREEKKFENE